jgi:hypothetical protein
VNALERHREGSSRGGRAWADKRRTLKAAGMAAAIAWREGRRCRALVPDPLHPSGTKICGALGYVPCAHRPNGFVASFGGEKGCPST